MARDTKKSQSRDFAKVNTYNRHKKKHCIFCIVYYFMKYFIVVKFDSTKNPACGKIPTST